MKNQKITGFLITAIVLAPLFGTVFKGYSKTASAENYLIVDEETLSEYKKKLPERSDVPRTPLYTGAEYAASVGMGEPIPEVPEQEKETLSKSTDNAKPILEPEARYVLTDEERSLIEHIVMSESGNTEPYEGQALIAQCLLDACELDNIRPFEAAYLYQYIAGSSEPNESVKKAVSDVFDKGKLVTEEPVVFYYNPRLTRSRWHESQIFVIEVGRHRFFKKSS